MIYFMLYPDHILIWILNILISFGNVEVLYCKIRVSLQQHHYIYVIFLHY